MDDLIERLSEASASFRSCGRTEVADDLHAAAAELAILRRERVPRQEPHCPWCTHMHAPEACPNVNCPCAMCVQFRSGGLAVPQEMTPEQRTLIEKCVAVDPDISITWDLADAIRVLFVGYDAQSRRIAELEERVKARPSINLRGEEVEAYEQRLTEQASAYDELADAYSDESKRVTELQRALEEAKKDATRYQWLREHADRIQILRGLPGECTSRESAEFDTRVDELIARHAQPSEGSENG